MNHIVGMEEIHSQVFSNGKEVGSIDLTKKMENGNYVIQGKTVVNGKTKNIYLTNRKKNRTFRVPKKRVHFNEIKESDGYINRKQTPYTLRKRLSRKQRNKK